MIKHPAARRTELNRSDDLQPAPGNIDRKGAGLNSGGIMARGSGRRLRGTGTSTGRDADKYGGDKAGHPEDPFG